MVVIYLFQPDSTKNAPIKLFSERSGRGSGNTGEEITTIRASEVAQAAENVQKFRESQVNMLKNVRDAELKKKSDQEEAAKKAEEEETQRIRRERASQISQLEHENKLLELQARQSRLQEGKSVPTSTPPTFSFFRPQSM